MAFNKQELVLDRVRFATTFDLKTKKMINRLTSIEEPNLSTSAESEEVVDALGSVITTLYRAKRASFSGSNSLINLDLAAAQFGTQKEVASAEGKIVDFACETKKVEGTTVKLDHVPVGEVLWIYAIEANEIATSYASGAEATATEFVIDKDGVITLPTTVTSGKIYVEYQYEAEEGVKVRNIASKYPESCELHIYAYFRDKCSDEIYSGKIICPKAKLSAESVELSLTSTGKHPFEYIMMRDYCAEDGQDELFSIIVTP